MDRRHGVILCRQAIPEGIRSPLLRPIPQGKRGKCGGNEVRPTARFAHHPRFGWGTQNAPQIRFSYLSETPSFAAAALPDMVQTS